MPLGVAKELEKIEASFLWGGTELKKKIHMVKWAEVTKSASLGGLGIRRIIDVNTSLLLKWWWKFGCEPNALWRKVLCSKYLIDEDRWQPILRPSCKYSRVWSDIISIAIHKQPLCKFFLDNFLIKVSDGKRVKFWFDKWCGNICLKDEFPSLYRLSTNKEDTLPLFYDKRSSSGNWSLSFRRTPYEWELVQITRLYSALSTALTLRIGEADRPVWLV